MLKNTRQCFGLVSITLHWLMAVLLISLFVMGLYMTSLDYYDPLYHRLPWWHKSLGLLTVFLLIVRFIWKLLNTAPEPLETHKTWEIFIAHLLQQVFYVLIALIGVAGYLISTSKGKSIDFFNGFEVPAIIGDVEESTADLFGSAHEMLAYVLAALVLLHAAAAVKHHFIDKDKTLKRMLGC